MSNSAISRDLSFLTKNITEPAHKPYLRQELTRNLVMLGHEEADVMQVLDNFFDMKERLH